MSIVGKDSRMTEQDSLNVKTSGWWGVGTFALMIGGGSILVTRSLGPSAVQFLMHAALMLIFLAGGILQGLLSIQALGASQRWGMSEEAASAGNEHAPRKSNGPLSIEETSQKREEFDPFYEILKQNRAPKRAA